MRAEDLCQLCGGLRGVEVFVLASEPRISPFMAMYGGSLGSRRCAVLTAAVCPHYRLHDPGVPPVDEYAQRTVGGLAHVGMPRDGFAAGGGLW